MLRGVIAAALAGFCLSPVVADDLLLSQLYGSGVHEYFAGDTNAAQQAFAQAIDLGSTDPRCFYFQGLSYLRSGQENEAAEVFAKGAALESRQTDRIYSVSKSLERVQGPARLTLERYRVEARRAAQMQRDAERKRRYRQMVDQMPKPAPRSLDKVPAEVTPENMPADDTAKARGTVPPAAPAKAPAPAAPGADKPAAEPMPPANDADPFAEPEEQPMEPAPGDANPPPAEAPAEEAPAETPPAEEGGEADPFADPGTP